MDKEIKNIKKYYEKIKKDLIQSINFTDKEVDLEGDDIDLIQGNFIISVQEQLSQRDYNKLKMIEESLKKIDLGIFGICEECGDSISFKRLEVLPGVKLCISCAEELEIKNKKF